MRVLIIDKSKMYMTHFRRELAEAYWAIEVTEFDADQHNWPGPEFHWLIYDVVFLDGNLGEDDEGLVWLRSQRNHLGFPPIIVTVEEGDFYLGMEAIKAGAADVLKRSDIRSERLKTCIEKVLAARGKAPRTKTLDTLSTLAPTVSLHPGGKVITGDYEFMRLIGQGGMGKVYLAKHQDWDRLLVIKTVEGQALGDPEALRRFEQEAELAAQLTSPYVVDVYDCIVSEGFGLIAMEFFSGGDLKQKIEGGFEPGHAKECAIDIALGITAIESAGIVHRDLKPGNIMFREDGSLALADFGIAKRLHGQGLTTIGRIMGTPHYFSPEQAEGGTVDNRSDLYGLGVILYEMLTGDKPYTATTLSGLVYQHVHGDLPQLPPHLKAYQPIVHKLLAKRPEDRYRSGHEAAEALTLLAA